MDHHQHQPQKECSDSNVVIIDFVQPSPAPALDVDESTTMTGGTGAAEEESLLSTLKTVRQAYKQNTTKAEEAALDYLTSEIHHPVISCFREITKTDIINIFSTHKIRKSLNNLESSVFCLGMIDYVAVCVDNPLYNENGKLSDKTVPKIITKILDEFKGVLLKWGQLATEKRLDVVFSFLRRLIPCFKAIEFDIQFSQLVDSLENEARAKKLQKSPNLAACVRNDAQPVLVELLDSNIIVVDNGTDKSPSINDNQKKFSNTKPKLLNSSARSIPAKNKTTKNGKREEHTDAAQKMNPTAGVKRPLVSVICKSQPASKAQKVIECQVAPNTKQGPPKNAFDILMNRSRQLAQQRKADLSNRK